ncbi:Pleckstrin homology domain-containing protein [Cynara cardunculus var. scolymus]|uniref:Pleckstrin homology domain-containing protein n=1 Tax=Cynara cardunculus var. scolymus TaxID=59895 RepID=A0A103YCW2_CYNCS|nr:Pleckstrin homology domain-containing protein [Cynara cardunculus var. scolymus]
MPPSSAAAQPLERQRSHNGSKVYKSGPLFLSSKGIGWTSWKKRWFILTETSLVFFRSDPNAAPQKGGESNLTLGGIDLNSSASVVVKADKKLLTVLFPVGRDGRAFTLKAETTEDLFEWKDALEAALANAPNAGTGPGQNGLLKNEKGDAADGSQEQSKDQPPAKSVVLGRPILLALEDIDGTPSFLEKALCYVEDYGVRVEGILRQAADVDDVERRIREYEQGKTEFTADEDGHVIGDCIKYVLRELPSPPVPASCCAALLEAYRSDRATRVSAIRAAICDTFPEPNRRLLQRILIMMEAVAENKAVNRMSVSAVAACMSPLLLRPLLAGEVDLGKGSDMGSDGSGQLLQAAAAANHAQAIVIILIEEYDKIFGGFVSTNPFDDEFNDNLESKKSSELANIEFVTEQQAEILRLEVTKIKLKEIIEAEARRNDILKEDLVSKKNALEARRVDVPKTNADPDDIIIDEAEADDPGLQQNCNYQPPTTTQDHGKVKDKDKDRESTTRSKDTKEDGDSKHDYFHSFSNKLTPSWHSDSDRNERSMSKSTSSRKSHSKGEFKSCGWQAANTSSALSKITNRLNFLKEKRNQMTDELQSADKTTHNNHRGSRKWSDDESDKGKETCVQQRELASGRSEDQGR